MFYHVLRETPDAYGKVTRLVAAITNMLGCSLIGRASGFDPGGYWFESNRPYHITNGEDALMVGQLAVTQWPSGK